jgi:hypothetical protein
MLVDEGGVKFLLEGGVLGGRFKGQLFAEVVAGTFWGLLLFESGNFLQA